MNVKIKKVKETAILPTRGTEYSAGMDLYVDTDKEITINPHETKMLFTNIAMEIPKGYYGAIYARSGLSTREGLRPATCVSVIDSDYRGNIGIPTHNDSNEPKTIKPGERVAQIVIGKYEHFDLVVVDSLEETDRGDSGFGSTGK